MRAATWINLENQQTNKSQSQKERMLHESIYMKCPEQVDLQRWKVGQWSARGRWKKTGVAASGYKIIFGMKTMF